MSLRCNDGALKRRCGISPSRSASRPQAQPPAPAGCARAETLRSRTACGFRSGRSGPRPPGGTPR